MTPLAGALLGLGTLGALDALYFTLVTYHLVRPDAAWLPRICRLDEGACARIVDTPEARVLGVPNALVGLGWYVALGAAALLGLPSCAWLLAGAAAAVALSAYLAWALLRKLRVACALCFLGHGVNVAVFAVLALACA